MRLRHCATHTTHEFSLLSNWMIFFSLYSYFSFAVASTSLSSPRLFHTLLHHTLAACHEYRQSLYMFKSQTKNNSQYIWHVILLLAHCHLCIGVCCACVHLRGWKSLVFDKWKSENCVATVFVVTIVVVAVIVIIFVVIAERVRHTGQCIHT